MRANPERLYRYIPFCGPFLTEFPVPVSEWNPIGYNVCAVGRRFGFIPPQACARRKFSERISLSHGIHRRATPSDESIVCGVVKTELDLQDTTSYAPTGGFIIWVLVLPGFIAAPEDDAGQWSLAQRVGSATIGDVMRCHWVVLIHGDLEVPELRP